MSELDSLLFLQQFSKYSCSFSLSESLCLFNPPFSISWSGLLFAVPLLSPCPRYLSLSQSRLANRVSFVELFASPAHFSTQVFEQTLIQSHSHAHMHMEEHAHIHTLTPSDDVSFTFILPLFPLECKTCMLSVKQPTTWQHHPGPETMFYLIVSTWLLTHIIQRMQYMEQDGWSDYKRTHGLTFISCFLVQIFSHFRSALD